MRFRRSDWVMAGAVELHGHRGARGLAPENTLEGFKVALSHGVDFLEIDVGLSRDNQVIIHHDRSLNVAATRRNGEWIDQPIQIRSLSVMELQVYDVGRLNPSSSSAALFPDQVPVDGARIPTLAQLLLLPEFAAGLQTRLNIEIKTSPDAPDETASPEDLCDALLREIDAHGLRQRCRIQSFDWRNLIYLRELAPDLELGFLTLSMNDCEGSRWFAGLEQDFDGTTVSLIEAIRRVGGQCWGPDFATISVDDVACAQAHGIKVSVWTVNAVPDMHRMLAFGVDAITTDYPDRARALLR